MNQINPQLQKILDDFAQNSLPNGKNSDAYHNLIAAVTASPILTERLNTAAEKGYLDKLAVNKNPNAGASYNAEETRISINLSQLEMPDERKSLIFQLGHEIQHGFFYYEQGHKETENRVLAEIDKIAESDAKRKDYTRPMKTLQDAERNDEALAMIAGWNAVVSYEQKLQGKTKLSLQEVVGKGFGYEQHFLDEKLYYLYQNNDPKGKIIPAKGLKFNPDMTVSDSQKEILARTYYDQPGNQIRLGPHGESDYRNSYATRIIGYIVRKHYAHDPKAELVIDMKGLGLDERLIERNGLDLGGENRRGVYYDKSHPKTPQYFDHTASGANRFEHVPITRPKAEDPFQAMMSRYQNVLDAYEHNDRHAVRNSTEELIRGNPDVRQLWDGLHEAEAQNRRQYERENYLYSLDNMPEQAQKLHAQITDKFTAYIKEHHLPYSEYGIRNSITALTAEAYAQKLPAIEGLVITKDNRLAVMHEDTAFLRVAEVNADKAMLTEPKDSFKDMLQTEQNLQFETEQREMERQMERSRSMVMSR